MITSFEQAPKAKPCIIFIDKLGALGRTRGSGPFGGSQDEKEQRLHQELIELDGFDPREGIVLLAAMNCLEIIDPALLRGSLRPSDPGVSPGQGRPGWLPRGAC